MYGDTAAVRTLAGSMQDRADQLRADADDLDRRVDAVPWTGLAADAMRRLAHDHANGLRASAGAHEAAADALDRHAREVDRRKELIAAIERRACHLLDSAAGGVARLVGHVVPDALDQWAHHFEPPAPGSRDWLDVRLPSAA